MRNSSKRKINLTINESIVLAARQVLENRGVSLSQTVEDFLSKLVHDSDLTSGGDWLDAFYAKHYPSNFREPTDSEIAVLLARRSEDRG
jgi:hypothetical protein